MKLPCSCRSLLRLSKRRATLTAANYFLSRFALIFIREDLTMEIMVKMILVLINDGGQQGCQRLHHRPASCLSGPSVG